MRPEEKTVRSWLGVCVLGLLASACVGYPRRVEAIRGQVASDLERATALATEDLETPRMEGVRNLVAASEALLFLSSYQHAALLLGVGTGRGFVLRRHGREWSDPVFVELRGMDLGLQVGYRWMDGVVFVLTHSAVEKILTGSMHAGTGAGAALFGWGLDASGTVALNSGLDTTVVSFAKGLYAGASYNLGWAWPVRGANAAFHGERAAQDVLGEPGSLPEFRALRGALSTILVDVQGVPRARSPGLRP